MGFDGFLCGDFEGGGGNWGVEEWGWVSRVVGTGFFERV